MQKYLIVSFFPDYPRLGQTNNWHKLIVLLLVKDYCMNRCCVLYHLSSHKAKDVSFFKEIVFAILKLIFVLFNNGIDIKNSDMF